MSCCFQAWLIWYSYFRKRFNLYIYIHILIHYIFRFILHIYIRPGPGPSLRVGGRLVGQGRLPSLSDLIYIIYLIYIFIYTGCVSAPGAVAHQVYVNVLFWYIFRWLYMVYLALYMLPCIEFPRTCAFNTINVANKFEVLKDFYSCIVYIYVYITIHWLEKMTFDSDIRFQYIFFFVNNRP